MAHRFTVKEIALQSGLSAATVDRALHGRAHLRAQTAQRVAQAIEELEAQAHEAQALGTRLTIDIVMQAPLRFTNPVRAAFESELPLTKPAAIRARFHLAEVMTEREILAKIAAIAKRGSHGVMVKLPATPAIEAQLDLLAAKRIPVVSYVTDLAPARRLAYVGMENGRAGARAAWLMAKMMGPGPARVLISQSSQMFEGEESRRTGFLACLAQIAPQMRCVTLSDGQGVNRTTRTLVAQTLAAHPDISCVYSTGGANRAILEAFDEAGRSPQVFAAHDLDRTNETLLRQGRLSFVLHHNFRLDARRVAQHFARHHRILPKGVEIEETAIQIALPSDYLDLGGPEVSSSR
ncbi:LacI family DNA-binding transcriptional regulator [Thioclava sp. GXIMD2076]|uniref:LacI family DNA-binding transcriptional regulator n=1 Tax=Thioclava kandeliae TaxID=3070818 RepID=A0ABV1SKT4_9RHOB